MKLNNKGFAISSIMYIILVLAVILIALTLAVLGNKKLILDKLKNEALNEVYNNTICIAVKNSLTGTVAQNDSNGDRIYRVGDEYLCEVREGIKYTFFVLSVEGEKVNLIMNRNINSDGSIAQSGVRISDSTNGKYSLVEWASQSDYVNANSDNTVCNYTSCTDEGPVTALKFLSEATKYWNNLEDIKSEISVEKIKDYLASDGIYYLEDSTEVLKNNYLNVKARLPKITEIISPNTGCQSRKYNSCSLWAANYLSPDERFPNENKTVLSGFLGYWGYDVNSEIHAWSVGSGADVWGSIIYNSESNVIKHGIRPVISVSKSRIK